MSDKSSSDEALAARLARLEAALAPTAQPAVPAERPRRRRRRSRQERGQRALQLGVALLVVAGATGRLSLLAPALLLLVLGGVMQIDRVGEAVLANLPGGLVQADATQSRIGMGATIAADAIVEPGATVEMGATVKAGAIIRQGAVVRMGSTIGAGAIIEANAVVSWGASVKKGAVVGAGASVGAGSDVGVGARLPAGMKLMPGVAWKANAGSAPELAAGTAPTALRAPEAPAVPVKPVKPLDPRRARMEAACEKLEGQLTSAPESFREMLGDPAKTVRTLRQTCLALLEREGQLRRESGPEQLRDLEAEQEGLKRRVETESDEVIRRSLQGAVSAIADQLNQRRALARNANRLDAEITRLLFTLEGMGAQLMRMQSAGADVATESAGVGASMQSLHDEVEALVGALEEIAHPAAQPSVMEPVVDVGDGSVPDPRTRERS